MRFIKNKIRFIKVVMLIKLVYFGGNDYLSLELKDYTLRKHAYSNILKILPPKDENFQIKNSDIF